MPTVTVRYFAAAREAAGVLEERVTVPDGGSVAHLLSQLEVSHGAALHRVLQRCSFLLDEIAVRDVHRQVGPEAATLDVLPPFAGG
jgi:molybdopterin converting factor small subunit